MRDDAVLGRALPLDRGLGPPTLNAHIMVSKQKFSAGPVNLVQCKLQNDSTFV